MNRARPTSLRRRLSTALIGLALVAVLLLSAVIYVFASRLIDDTVQSQLTAVRDGRVEALEAGMARLQSRVSALAANSSVEAALVDLSNEFQQIDGDATSEEIGELVAVYDTEFLPPIVDAGVDLPAIDLVPQSAAGRYLQSRYIAQNPNGFDERDRLDDAGDGSGYSAAHAEHHPLLRSLMENAGTADLFLVDADGNVVYSTKKRIEFGTNGLTGPYANNVDGVKAGLGEVLDKLTTVAVGDTVVSDSVFYVPTAGDPVFFLAAAIRSEREVVGAIVTEVPVEVVTAAMTAQQDWELLGLGDTGESYIVGVDRQLRSDSRAWLEDPDDYLRRFVDQYGDQDEADLIATIGSPVLLQSVDNEAVTAGLDGTEFVGSVSNYLGIETLATSAPARVADLGWVVVVELDESETDNALNSLLRGILLVLAVLLPTIALVGAFLARILTKPAKSLVRSASLIADGDLQGEVEDLGDNELGDVGRQLQGVAQQLESQEQAIRDEEQHINDMLAALLPKRLIDRVRQGERAIKDIVDTATVVSVTVDVSEVAGDDPDLELEIAEQLNGRVGAIMERYGVERIRQSSGSQLFLTGLDQEDVRAVDAAEFTLAMTELATEIGAEYGHQLYVRAGMSAGDVATGVLGDDQLAFGVWGDPPGVAETLASLAGPGQVLVDVNVAQALSEWDIEPVAELPGLADNIAAYAVNGPLSAIAEIPQPDRT